MTIRSSILVISPNQHGREAVVQAIHFEKISAKVTSFRTLEESLNAIRNDKKADIVLVSAMFAQRDLGEFVGAAKQTRNGRDGAYILIFEESVSRVIVAKSILKGIDGFVVAPFSAEDMHNVLVTAETVRQQNLKRRIEAASNQIIDVLRDDIDGVAYDLKLGKKASFKGSVLDASQVLQTFNNEELQFYFDLLVSVLINTPPPQPFIVQKRGEKNGIEPTIEDLIEDLKDPHGRTRANAARALAALGVKAAAAIPYLNELLKDPNGLCRHRAKAALEVIEGVEREPGEAPLGELVEDSES